MNIYNLIFEAIIPVKVDSDVVTLTGINIPKGEKAYKVKTLDYRKSEVVLGYAYLLEKEFDNVRNNWHCYDMDTNENIVTLRKNNTIPMGGMWNAPITRMIYEQDLPDDITKEEYDKWYKTSTIVDGVRMGKPFERKDLNYWKENAEDAYIKTPICVLKYITKLEESIKINYDNK